jgi:gluconolactonase
VTTHSFACWITLLASGVGNLGLVMAQEKLTLEKLDPAVDAIIPADAKLEKLASGFKWTEGPVWIENKLLFAEIPSNTIRELKPGGSPTIFMEPSGYTGSTPYGGPEPGSNGMTLDPKGRLTVAGHARRSVWRLESLDPKGQITVLADRFEGKRLNSPNDLVYGRDGSLYFTDPPYGLPSQGDQDPAKELSFNGVYKISKASAQPAGSEPIRSNLQLIVKDLSRPNGLAFSPDDRYLYVANSDPQKKIWMRYRMNSNGTVEAGTLFADATSDRRDGLPDGMKVDSKGNLYCTGPGGIWLFSPEGKHIGTIVMPEKTANLAWGDADGKSLYIAATSSIYRLKLNIPGLRP